ncbi:MAG: hypothetical protein GXO00_01865 [Candidatus Diapherotrites archaeon]|nr:hypothetical protein [Candidatus Diapherotrites archaeon]
MDTASSLAIRWIENLVSVLERWKRSGSVRDKEGIIDKISSLVKEMKYSYLEPQEISIRYVEPLSKLLATLLSMPLSEKQRRFVAYVKEEVEDLPRKLKLNPTEPFQVFRYRFVTVQSVSKHPSLDLRVTRTRDRHGIERTVVTNVKDVKSGQNALIVVLPSRDFDGVWSEAMFVALDVSEPSQVKLEDLRKLNAYFNVDL